MAAFSISATRGQRSILWSALYCLERSEQINFGHVSNVWLSKAVAAVEEKHSTKKRQNFSDFMCSLKSCSGAAVCSIRGGRQTRLGWRLLDSLHPFHISSALISTSSPPQLAQPSKRAAVSDKDGEICRARASEVMQEVKGRWGMKRREEK